MIGADAIIKCLEEEGVKYVFGHPRIAEHIFYALFLKTFDYCICTIHILLHFRTALLYMPSLWMPYRHKLGIENHNFLLC